MLAFGKCASSSEWPFCVACNTSYDFELDCVNKKLIRIDNNWHNYGKLNWIKISLFKKWTYR